jgi:hypothetical protein
MYELRKIIDTGLSPAHTLVEFIDKPIALNTIGFIDVTREIVDFLIIFLVPYFFLIKCDVCVFLGLSQFEFRAVAVL